MLFAKALRCQYTRYADDLTFSTNLPHLPSKLARVSERIELGSAIISIIGKHGFKITRLKPSAFTCGRRGDWLNVNEFANVRRDLVRSMSGDLIYGNTMDTKRRIVFIWRDCTGRAKESNFEIT